jgi:ketosteroid isomerase-like protein
VSQQNVEMIRRGYDAWNRGDVEAIVGVMDPQVQFRGHPRLPEPGPYVGREAVKRWFENARDAWETISVRPVAFEDADDRVVVLVSIAGRGRGSGVEVQSGLDAHIWTIAEGLVVSFRWLQGDEAAKRANLSPREAEVLRMRAALDLPDSEIAQRLRLSEAEVRSIAEVALAKVPLLAKQEGQ